MLWVTDQAAHDDALVVLEDEMESRGVSVDEVARFLGDYRLADNGGAVSLDGGTRLFEMAIPGTTLESVECS